MAENYDIAIVGGGPAGLTAAIYAARYKLNTVVITTQRGGMITESFKVGNFPSYDEITGTELMKRMEAHASGLGVKLVDGYVETISKTESGFLVKGPSLDIQSKEVILATGQKKRKLGIEREDELAGKGVSYCAICDAAFFRGEKVAVVGGGDSAVTSALLLSQFADKVYIVYRRDKFFRAEPTWVEQLKKNSKIEPVLNTTISKLVGENALEAIELTNGRTLEVTGLFVEVGEKPNSALAKESGVALDEHDYIITDDEQRTNVPGLFAAGDVTNNKLKQVVVACAEGAIAATQAYKDISASK